MAGWQSLGRTNLKEILFYLGLQIVIKQDYNGLLKKHCANTNFQPNLQPKP